MAISTSFFVFASLLLVSASAATEKEDNPADELVSALNRNRTVHRSSALANNPGLACIALQYIKAYQGDCKDLDDKKPAESEFIETFAPNCGVEASTLSPITGRLVMCQTKYISAPEAFSNILIHNNRSLEILYSNHTQVGAAVSGTSGGSPYFWCVLFSAGSRNETFLLDGGVAKTQRPGCFSGADEQCSGADGVRRHHWLWSLGTGVLIVVAYGVGL